ncbi:glutaredoxin-C1-like [Wolffia australiana]
MGRTGVVVERWREREEGKGGRVMAAEKRLGGGAAAAYERLRRIVAGNAVVVFSLSGCCMCHVVKRLLLGLGVGPAVFDLDVEKGGAEMQAVLRRLISASVAAAAAAAAAASSSPAAAAAAAASSLSSPPLPAVFVGGKLVGGLEAVMACHISGSLIPLLKNAGALWL